MLLDDEAVALSLELAPLGFLRLREVALPVVGLDVEAGALRHDSGPFARWLFVFLLGGGALLRRRLLWLGFSALLVAKTLLERRHEVDDVRSLRRSLVRIRVLDNLFAFLLLLLGDQLFERIDVAIVKFGRVELTRFP